MIVPSTPAEKRPHQKTYCQPERSWLKLVLLCCQNAEPLWVIMGCNLACWALCGGSLHCIAVESSWSQPSLVVWWVLFVLKFLLLKKKANFVPLSAPQRPIATHRTTATPKAGPGVVRKNPGVGNGDDEAAELMQQVGISCVHNRSPLGEGALAALTGSLCLCSCGKTCLVCVSQQSLYHSSPRDVSGLWDLCGDCERGHEDGRRRWAAVSKLDCFY